jgi:hypothetical protein
MEMAALYGIFQPLEGRVLFAEWEAELHQKTVHDHIWCDDWGNPIERLLKNPEEQVCFIAPCMQPTGLITDAHVRNVRFLPQT